jgi:hypothetical protein
MTTPWTSIENPEARGYSADDLYAAHLAKVAETLNKTHPELKERGVQTYFRILSAEKELEAMKVEIRKALGDGAEEGATMMRKEAAQRIAAAMADAALSAKTAVANVLIEDAVPEDKATALASYAKRSRK